ncbi:MAG: hypothetical protein U9R16_04160 [Campylobacterota bacterium]|nr:hypothetical protein [Campylobacterota bacterium]
MSFKQAKELTEQLELAEVTLGQTLKKIEHASKNFDKSLEKQEKILHYMPVFDRKLNLMKIVVAVNIGFIFGLVVSKYLF